MVGLVASLHVRLLLLYHATVSLALLDPCAPQGAGTDTPAVFEASIEAAEVCESVAVQVSLLQIHPSPGRREVSTEEINTREQYIVEAEESWSGLGAAGEFNLCRDGKLLPEFYLLGPEKCGTSTLSEDMRRAGVASAAEPYKEFKFFAMRRKTLREVVNLSKSKRAEWLALLPNCSQSDFRRILADYSPQNIYLTKAAPEGWRAENFFGGFNIDLPSVLYNLYGTDAKRLTLAVVLREPLGRYQSYFYYEKRTKANTSWEELPAGSFQNDVEDVLLLDDKKQLQHELVAGALYSQHLQEYLRRFHPSQLVVVPFLEYMAGDRSLTFRELSARLGVGLRLIHEDSVVNPNEHPPLDTDISVSLREAFNRLMVPEKDNLVRVLADASVQGATLVGFTGQKGSELDVRNWLDASW